MYKAASIRLKTLIERDVDCFLYVYDFGDDWRHDIFIESVRDGEADVDCPAFVHGGRLPRRHPRTRRGLPGSRTGLPYRAARRHLGAVGG